MAIKTFLALILCAEIVSVLKASSGVACPYEVRLFGGVKEMVVPYAYLISGIKAGHCWPAGHASCGFSLFVLYFVSNDNFKG